MKETNREGSETLDDSQRGFSIAELVIVVAIIAILSVAAIMSFANQKMYEADAQTLTIIDFFQEARQRALSQRSFMRVEINATLKAIRLIDEKLPNNAADDVVIKSTAFMDNGVFIGSLPSNITGAPTELAPVPVTPFAASNHPLSVGNSVIVLRFRSNGVVYNAGTDGAGANAAPTGSTIFVWSKAPKDPSPTPTQAQVMRATTVLASSSSAKVWKCLLTNNACSTWTKN
jgi:prepilin-type N-terminal cleavage/methylation domain-containing protein